MARRYVYRVVLFLVAGLLPAQEIVTAQDFFQGVSDTFSGIEDYTCRFTFTRGDTVSTGTLYYRSPNLLRLDFATPANQAVLMDGKNLTIYVPSAEVLLVQSLRSRSASELEAMASDRALRMFQEGYEIAYLDTPDPVPLEEGSRERVVKLKLTRRAAREMYREVILSISADNMIRRMEGILEERVGVVMDYADIRVDQGVPDSRFREEDWADANRVENFLTGGN